MKTKTYARLALFFPYLILIESATYFINYTFDSERYKAIENFNSLWNLLAVFWFIPYTILVIGLLVWSKGRSDKEIQDKFEASPFILMGIALITYSIIFLAGVLIDANLIEELFWALVILSIFSIFGSVILGYIFIIITHLLYKLLQTIKFIKD